MVVPLCRPVELLPLPVPHIPGDTDGLQTLDSFFFQDIFLVIPPHPLEPLPQLEPIRRFILGWNVEIPMRLIVALGCLILPLPPDFLDSQIGRASCRERVLILV